MNFVDRIVVRLAVEDTRASVLSSDALGAVAAAAYDVDAMPISGPFGGRYDEFTLGYAVPAAPTLEGGWSRAGGADRTEVLLRVSGLGSSSERVDALWRGAIVAHAAPAVDRIESVVADWTSNGDEHRAGVQLAYSGLANGEAVVTALPVAVALLIRDAGFSLADLLARSQDLLLRLRPAGVERPADPALRQRHAIVVAWVVPSTVFADAGWPGADPERRQAAAAAWLAREGIALLTVPLPD